MTRILSMDDNPQMTQIVDGLQSTDYTDCRRITRIFLSELGFVGLYVGCDLCLRM